MLTDQEKKETIEIYRLRKLEKDQRELYYEISEYRRIIEETKEKIVKSQTECSHPLVMRETENRGSTGNWDRNDDSYWTNHECTLCGKRWTTDQDWEKTENRKELNGN